MGLFFTNVDFNQGQECDTSPAAPPGPAPTWTLSHRSTLNNRPTAPTTMVQSLQPLMKAAWDGNHGTGAGLRKTLKSVKSLR